MMEQPVDWTAHRVRVVVLESPLLGPVRIRELTYPQLLEIEDMDNSWDKVASAIEWSIVDQQDALIFGPVTALGVHDLRPAVIRELERLILAVNAPAEEPLKNA